MEYKAQWCFFKAKQRGSVPNSRQKMKCCACILLTFAPLATWCDTRGIPRKWHFATTYDENVLVRHLLTANDKEPDSCLLHSVNAGQKCISIVPNARASFLFKSVQFAFSAKEHSGLLKLSPCIVRAFKWQKAASLHLQQGVKQPPCVYFERETNRVLFVWNDILHLFDTSFS